MFSFKICICLTKFNLIPISVKFYFKLQKRQFAKHLFFFFRQSVYMEGGVIFSSSRILVVVMLMGRLPIELVTGVLVYKAHHVIETSQEAFILRLYRQKNKKGFIKAFSSSPVSFTRGFSQVNRVMRSLFVRHLFLWPRFQATIQGSLKENEVFK